MKNLILKFHSALAILFLIASGEVRPASAEPIPMDFDKNAVQFIFTKAGTNFVPLGTCFGVDVASTHKRSPIMWFFTTAFAITQHNRYFVTAKHVLFDERGNLRPDLYMRADVQGGGVALMLMNPYLTNEFSILTHTNKSVDIAVIAFSRVGASKTVSSQTQAQATQQVRLGSFDSQIIADKKLFKKYGIREGDDMFFVGLFTPFYGSKENIPICRFGRLSMLTDETIPWGNEGPENLYLMETQAFGGNSGAPAFFSFSKGRKFGAPSFLLAGVVKGYFRDWSEIQMVNTAVTPISSQHTGITAIVPAHYLYEILFSDDEKKFRSDSWKTTHPNGYN
jgi:hypothetical protein